MRSDFTKKFHITVPMSLLQQVKARSSTLDCHGLDPSLAAE